MIFIGEWPEETTTVKASERVFVCHLASLINAGCFPSGGHQLWSSHAQVEEKGALGGDVCIHVRLIGVSVYTWTCVHDLPVFMPVLSERFKCVCFVFGSVFSLLCVESS